jgi:peptidoglycan/LPS O-acetylase OafA/YrhL
MTFQPRLDSLRGYAIAAVFIGHLGFLDCGWTGVQAFFVLSGYLITGVLLESRDAGASARQYFVNFHIRRALRIFPVYVVYIFLPLAIAGLLGDSVYPAVHENFLENIPYLATYTENFYNIAAGSATALYSHLWSLSVEEQFYLIWPFVLFFTNRDSAWKLCACLIVAGPLIRLAELAWQLQEGLPSQLAAGRFIYYFTASHADAFAFGAILNFAREQSRVKALVQVATKFVPPMILMISGCMLAAGRLSGYEMPISSLGWAAYLSNFWTYIWGYTLLNALFFVVIANVDRLGAFTDIAFMRRLGRISYGFYIFHFPMIWVVRLCLGAASAWANARVGIVAFGLTWALAEVSFRFLESPILRLKNGAYLARLAGKEIATRDATT